MTIKEAKERIKEIESFSSDPEAAHSKEDDFHLAVLSTISIGNKNSKQLARLALKTQNIKFPRWCA